MEMLIPIAAFVMVAAIVIMPRYFQSQERQKMAETLRAAIERGETLSPDLLNSMAAPAPVRQPPSPARDLRTGIIWLGVAIGVAVFGVALGFQEPDATFVLLGFSALPGFIGLAFIVLGLINRKNV